LEQCLEKRIDFALDLLRELKDLSEELTQGFDRIEKNSLNLYNAVFEQEKRCIQDEIENYQRNAQKINRLNQEIITTINSWYDFSKDPREIKKLFFPVRFWSIRRKLKKRIKSINEEIGRMEMENRFIKEKIAAWEHELEQKALFQIKQGEHYQEYLRMMERKAHLISDLKYLLATLPLTYPVTVDIKNMDSFIKHLISIKTAS
jgi:vacuolar-type H+-ATPase subunit E/Vma4